ncbi:hypothetical protein ABFS83_09G118600 [Erythranthe nasuta]
MAAEFSAAVDVGLRLCKRIYYGKDAAAAVVSVPPRTAEMSPEVESYLPAALMVYAEINDPAVVDNPDVPSYQPYVHGRCETPALIPLHMHGVSVEVDCCLDTAFVTVGGAWRVHCVSASRSCYCRIAVPIGEQGSVLGVEIETPSKSYSTQLISLQETADAAKVESSKDGFLIKGQIYTLKIPKVSGGTMLSVKVSWSQKLIYQDGQFRLNVPFTFPSYVNPVSKNLVKNEKISVNVNSVAGTEFSFRSTSHPLKRIGEEDTKFGFRCEREVPMWSLNDFNFSYNVCSSEIIGGLLLQSPSTNDFDRREMFCFYLYPGKKSINTKVFRKEVVYIVDISASMQGSQLERVKTAILASLLNLNPTDTFNVIAFNEKTSLFSSSNLVPANKETIKEASEWIEVNFIAKGGTNISAPLNQAIKMFSKTGDLLPVIFLVTDGSVEDEKGICDSMRSQLMKGGLTSPRICTFGIGLYCNHYFLQMLAQIGRGCYDAAFDIGSINARLERLISNASSIIVADITVDALKNLDSLEIYPFNIPDLLSGCPLFISGRFRGDFPKNVEVNGTLAANSSNFVMKMKVQNAKDIPLDKIFARRQINALTTNAWFSGSKELEEKATKLSLLTAVPSEYTTIILVETIKNKLLSNRKTLQEKTVKEQKNMIYMRRLGIGYGNIVATVENRAPENAEPKLYESTEIIFKAASNLCGRLVDCCCCMCFIQFCNRLNDQCAIALTQLCTALACFGCIEMCCDVCSCDCN